MVIFKQKKTTISCLEPTSDFKKPAYKSSQSKCICWFRLQLTAKSISITLGIWIGEAELGHVMLFILVLELDVLGETFVQQ